MRIPFDKVKEITKKAFLNIGLPETKAEICAQVHSETSLDGVQSHGLNRIPRFAIYVKKGWVNVNAEPELVSGKGAVENYNGNLGIGITNAIFCTDRAVELAKSHGIGCVTLKNTTHWMRGGTYAWRAAKEGFIGINWTNTESCMPMWGSVEPGVGNNPFCISIPRKEGPVVLDMALSQYSFGKIGTMILDGKQLPYPGGFDKNGNLTNDPKAIEESNRILPVGYWKGSGFALALDLAAAIMANGKTGHDLDTENRGSCTGCSQVFIAYDPYIFGDEDKIQDLINSRLNAIKGTQPEKKGETVAYPGERTKITRERNLREGVLVNERIWQQVEDLAKGIMVTEDISAK